MQEREVRLHAIQLDGALNPYPQVKVVGEEFMPSGGDLSNPNDKALVKSLEDQMIEAYGNALVQAKCKAAGGETVDLSAKMIRPVHVDALFLRRWSATRSRCWSWTPTSWEPQAP